MHTVMKQGFYNRCRILRLTANGRVAPASGHCGRPYDHGHVGDGGGEGGVGVPVHERNNCHTGVPIHQRLRRGEDQTLTVEG